MERIAEFFKLSSERYAADGNINDYPDIRLPERATAGSAGYDFFMPYTATVNAGETVTVPTGIRAKINDGWVLQIYPRSSLGFKYRLTLNNTVGIIDGDYFNAKNEGHIFVRMTNCGNTPLTLPKGQAFCQGVFTPYGITVSDCAAATREGGIGSTDKK